VEKNNFLRWAHTFFFSSNIAWMVIWIERANNRATHFLVFSSWVQEFYLRSGLQGPVAVLVQVLWSIILAILIFVLVHLLSRLRMTRILLSTLGGFIALAGFPLIALCFPTTFFQTLAFERRFPLQTPWLLIELTLVTAGGILFYLRKPRVIPAIGIFILILHFGFWSWLTGTHPNPLALAQNYGFIRLSFWISLVFYWGFPVIGLLSSLAWGLYVTVLAETEPASSA